MVDVITTGTLILDESAGNTENDTNLTNANPALAISAGFYSYLTTNSLLTGIIEEAKGLTITVDRQGSVINSLSFTNAAGQPFSQTVGTQVFDTISGLAIKTIGGENVFLFGTADPDVVIARDTSGDLVAVFYLNDPADLNVPDSTLTASVEMVAYQALEHHSATRDGGETAATQDLLDWGDQLSVSATGSLKFSFDNLDSGNFLYAAFGTTAAGIVLTGEDLNVNDELKQNGTPGANFGEEVNGGSDPTDTMNTSQGGAGATIGVNAQDFRPDGGTAVVTFVTGFIPLTGITDGSTFGHDVRDILYDDYINTAGASIFLSQQTGNEAAGMTVSLWEAGGNNSSVQDTTDNAPADLVEEEGYGPVPNPPADNSGYIGDDDGDTQLKNDWPVAVASVTVVRGGTEYSWTSAGGTPASTPPTYQGVQLNVTFGGNAFTVVGLTGLDEIKFTATDDPTKPLDGTFNRFKIEPTAGNFDIGAISLTQGVGDLDVIGDNIFTDDDRPVQNTTVVTKAVGEDTLSTTDSNPADTIPADLSDGIPDAGDTKTDEVTYLYTDIDDIVDVGRDTPADTSLRSGFTAGTAVTIADTANTQLKSKGENVFWAVEAGTGVVQGVTGSGRIVFEITDNGTTGYLFDLQDQVDHADASGENGTLSINLTPAFVITDDDLDPAALTGQAILVSVENDVPAPKTATPISREVHEDALTGGNSPDAGDSEAKVLTATYTAANLATLVTSGADEDVAFSLNTATSGGVISTNVVTTGGANVTSKEVNVTWAAGTVAGTLRGITTVGTVVTTIFTLAPSATPNQWVFTLADQVDHSGAEDDLEVLPIDLTKAFTGLDFDKDPVALPDDSVVLNVENDLPLFASQIAGSTIDQGDKTPVSKSLNGAVGADENPHYVIDKYENLAGYVEEINAANTLVSYYVDSDPGAGETKGAIAFTLEVFDTNTLVSPSNNTGMYTFTNFLDRPQEKLEFDFTFFPSGASLFGILLDNDEQSDLTPDSGLLVIGRNVVLDGNGNMLSGTDTINTSAGGGPVTIGVGNQMFDPGDGAVFVYLKDPERNSSATQSKTDGLTQNTADDADALGFGGMITSLGGSVEVVQRQGSETLAMKITPYNLDDVAIVAALDPLGGKTRKDPSDDVSQDARDFVDNSDGNPSTPDDVLSTGDEVKIITIKVFDTGATTAKATFTINPITGAVTPVGAVAGITVDADQDNDGAYDDVVVTGFDANDTIEWVTNAGHDAVLIEGAGGAWDVGGFNIEQGVDTADVEIDFSVAITDRDNDSFSGSAITLDDFTIRLDGTGANDQEPDVDPPAPSPSVDSVSTLLSLNAFQDSLF